MLTLTMQVKDKRNGQLPDGLFVNMSNFSVRSWLYCIQSWGDSIWVQGLTGTVVEKVCRCGVANVAERCSLT
jgi:hypothetical protein